MMTTETALSPMAAVHGVGGGGGGGGKIRRPSLKYRGGASSHHQTANEVRGYRVTVPSSMVTELATKFNAIIVDTVQGDTARDIAKGVNKSLTNGATVRATVKKFESADKKPNQMIVVRTNTERRRSSIEQIKSQVTTSPQSSYVKLRLELFQKTEKPDVPKSKPNFQKTQKRLQQSAKDGALPVPDVHLSAKHKRLSIARDPDAQLESVLNAIPQPQIADTSFLHSRTRPVEQPALTNPVAEPIVSTIIAETPSMTVEPAPNEICDGPDEEPPVRQKMQNSFLHTYIKKPDAVGQQHNYNDIGEPQAIYEELEEKAEPKSPLPDVELENTYYDPNDHHYTTIDSSDQNIYDDVITSTDPNRRDYKQQQEDSYETVEAPPPPPPPPQIQTPAIVKPIVSDTDPMDYHPTDVTLPDPNKEEQYDSCEEICENSMYNGEFCSPWMEDCPHSESNFSDTSADSASVIGNSKVLVNDGASSAIGNSKFYVNEEWVDEEWEDVDNTSDDLQEIIVVPSMPPMPTKPKEVRSGWSIQIVKLFMRYRFAKPPPVMPSSSFYCSSPSSTPPPPLPPARTLRRRKSLYIDKVSISSQSVISFVKDVPEQCNKAYYSQHCSPTDSLQQLTVVLKTVFSDEKFESQELSLFFDNEVKHNKSATINHETPEEIYTDYDSFDTDDSSDDCKDSDDKTNHVSYPCKNRVLPDPPSNPNIYGLVPMVKRASNRVKQSWSLGIRKLSMGNMTASYPGNKMFDKSDKSNDKKYYSSDALMTKSSKNLTSSTFYLNDSPTYANTQNNNKIQAPIRNASKPPSSIDSRRLSVARPSSPPPPPPVKKHSTENNSYGSIPRSIVNSKGRPTAAQLDKPNSESVSENSSNQGSELYMRFADEPLYQFYAADISQRSKSVFAGDLMEECDGYEEISSVTSRPSALELITPCSTGHGQHRSLWCEVPEVKNSGILDALTPRERKLQEAKFELITSEASYFKSLTVLEKHFVNSPSMNDETILCKSDRKILFGNVNTVRKCSEKLLAALEKCWQDNILLRGLCEILYTHSQKFDIFVKYCSNQIYIDRTLKTLREKNFKFNEALQRLETDTKSQSLSLHSFLMLPMQRITRLPLLVDAILSQMDSTENSTEYQMCELTLASLNAVVQNCNESTRKLERYEEMLLLSQQLEFSSKREMKAMSVASSSRWLVRSGSMLHLTSPDAKLTLSRKMIKPTKLYFFLFNDMFFIAKRKSDDNYIVVDYCARNFVQMTDATQLVISSSYKNLLMLTILENHESKTVEMLLSCDSESSKKRWIEAMSPPISSNPDETLYNEWDCPQVYTEHAYTAIQPDELSLQNGDIVKVLTKMNDGWYHGERIRDGEKGWFPGNYTSEIASQHARAKNLKQRYRLLAMSGSYLQSQLDKTKKK